MNPQIEGEDWQMTTKNILERNCFMFNNPFLSDIVFTCGSLDATASTNENEQLDVTAVRKSFFAHKYVLCTSSPVFVALFFGDTASKENIVHLPDTDEQSMEEFLRFLYTDECKMTPDIAGKLLYLAKKFMVPFLTQECSKCLTTSLSPHNVCAFLELSVQYDLKQLNQRCWDIIDSKTRKVISSDAFNNLEQATITDILKRDKLNVLEVELFQALEKWSSYQCTLNGIEATSENQKTILGDALYKLRFLLMSQVEFARYVSTSGLLTDDETVAVYDKFSGLDILPSNALRQSFGKPQRRPKKSLLLRPARFTNLLSVKESAHAPDATHRICFSVDKPVTLYGVSLFGDKDWKGAEYKVRLQVEEVKVDDVYQSKCGGFLAKMLHFANTFDVMLPRAIRIDENKVVEISACVNGPKTFLGSNGESVQEIEGLKVTFWDSPLAQPSSITNINQGQFYQLILSSID